MSISVVRSPVQGACDARVIETGNSRFKECLTATPPSRQTSQDSQEDDPNDSAPDGGTAAWLIVVGGWCAMFSSYGWLHSKLLYGRWLRRLGYSGSLIIKMKIYNRHRRVPELLSECHVSWIFCKYDRVDLFPRSLSHACFSKI